MLRLRERFEPVRRAATRGHGMGEEEVEVQASATEERQILLWRVIQFTQLGFDYSDAIVLAEARVDLGDARRLIAAGCPVATASRILL